jgi:hypothetical protein
MSNWRTWSKVIAALSICVSIGCSEQILLQLIAHVASLDHDHGVSLYATSDGVDLILRHDPDTARPDEQGQSLAVSSSQPAHVIHIVNVPGSIKQDGAPSATNDRRVAGYFSTVTVIEFQTFVPQMLLAYSRPPPDELPTLLVRRGTVLLI